MLEVLPFEIFFNVLIPRFLVFSAVISAVMLRPADSGGILRPGHGEVFQDHLDAIRQSLEAGELHPGVDTGALRPHLTHQTNLTIQRIKINKTQYFRLRWYALNAL